MKKILLLAVAVVAISTVSCKKERTCDCKTTTTDVTTFSGGSSTSSSSSTDKQTAEKMSKKFFKRATSCYGNTTETTSTGTGYTTVSTDVTTCDLK